MRRSAIYILLLLGWLAPTLGWSVYFLSDTCTVEDGYEFFDALQEEHTLGNCKTIILSGTVKAAYPLTVSANGLHISGTKNAILTPEDGHYAQFINSCILTITGDNNTIDHLAIDNGYAAGLCLVGKNNIVLNTTITSAEYSIIVSGSPNQVGLSKLSTDIGHVAIEYSVGTTCVGGQNILVPTKYTDPDTVLAGDCVPLQCQSGYLPGDDAATGLYQCQCAPTNDTDTDGICDDVDDDTDGDGVANNKDNCLAISSEDQTDGDKDGLGVPCDADDSKSVIKDSDADGLTDEHDNCPLDGLDADQTDADGDGFGKPCDPDGDVAPGKGSGTDDPKTCTAQQILIGDTCVTQSIVDTDGDGLIDSQDNCPQQADPTNLCKTAPPLVCAQGMVLSSDGKSCSIADPGLSAPVDGGGCTVLDLSQETTDPATLLLFIILCGTIGLSFRINRTHLGILLGVMIALTAPTAQAAECTDTQKKLLHSSLLVKYPIDSTTNGAALLISADAKLNVDFAKTFKVTVGAKTLVCGDFGDQQGNLNGLEHYYVCQTALSDLALAHVVQFTARPVSTTPKPGEMIEACTVNLILESAQNPVVDATKTVECTAEEKAGCGLVMCSFAEALRKFTIALVSDPDKDQIGGLKDNCPFAVNADQTDADLDGLGDVCEPDTDGDGVLDDSDICPHNADADQLDTDSDGLGDACDDDDDSDSIKDAVDPCPLDALNKCKISDTDTDADGVLDHSDNCPAVDNADQLDTDGDGTGDACGTVSCLPQEILLNGNCSITQPAKDSDGDGISDLSDSCPSDPTNQCKAGGTSSTDGGGSCSLML